MAASTKKAARALGWEKELGTFEAGKLTGLIIVKKNPLADLKTFADRTNIEMVMQGGKVVVHEFAGDTGFPEELMTGAWICCDR